MPQSFVAAAIIAAARAVPNYPRLKVLDLSSARGEILDVLAHEGCDVRGTHYRPDDYKLVGQSTPAGHPVDENVDLTQPLPYSDGYFDLVILSEVIEHLPSHFVLIPEIGRILRKDGRLLLSTPNIQRLHSRLHFFWTGAHKLIRRRTGWDTPAGELYAYHINPVGFPVLHTLLFQANLTVESLRFTRFKARHAWLFLLYPLTRLSCLLEYRGQGGNEAFGHGERDLRRWMTHPAMLGSEQLLLTARRV